MYHYFVLLELCGSDCSIAQTKQCDEKSPAVEAVVILIVANLRIPFSKTTKHQTLKLSSSLFEERLQKTSSQRFQVPGVEQNEGRSGHVCRQ